MTITTGTCNAALWERILPDIAQWLTENPLASCAEAGKRFGINHATLASRLDNHYPGKFDFIARRKARGDMHRKPKPAKAEGGVNLRREFDRILTSLARIEALLQKEPEATLFDSPRA